MRMRFFAHSRGVAHLRLLGDGDGALGQAFEDQVIEGALLGEFDGRLDAVAGVTGAAAYA
jgi:hypothetical protein